MKTRIFLILACLSMGFSAFADRCGDWSDCCCTNCFGFDSVLMVDVGGGYRNDSLKWKVHPASQPETTLLEKWSNVGMGIVDVNAYFLACEHFLVKADFDYGWFTKSGHQTYRVSEGDLVSENLRARTHGHVYDLSGGVGYQFNFDCYRVSLAPQAGYGYSFQQYKNSKYENVLDEAAAVDDETFHNRYKYRWSGPWLGGALAYQPWCDFLLYFDYAFHWLKFHGHVHENFFFNQPPARINTQNAYGNEYTVGGDYVFCDGWLLGLRFNYKEYWATKARFRSDNDDDHSPVRKLRLDTYYIALNIGYKF